MKLITCEDLNHLAASVTAWGDRATRQYRARSIFVPAGQTPVPVYAHWKKVAPEFLSTLAFLQIDDILTGPQQGLFAGFLREHLSPFQKQIKFIESANETADLCLLGLGLNGHVAFHEPEIAPGFFSGCVPLSAKTQKTLGVAPGTWGITYGAGAFMRSKSILFMVSGASKRDILKRLLAQDQTLPASWLLMHPDVTIVADQAALKGAKV